MTNELTRRDVLKAGSAALGAVTLPSIAASATSPSRPNIIVILSDDQGRGDYSAFGTKDIRTPNIDRICAEGMTFDNFYASAPVCSPTRAALLTGCYPDRVGVPGVIRHVPADSWGYLSPRAVLLPQLIKQAGYHTAIVGKWHLGLESPNTPTERGFDYFHGFLGDMMDDYLTHRRSGQNFMRLGKETIDPQGHATDLFTQWACEYIAERARAAQPFFLYLAYNAPHDPTQPPKESLDRVLKREEGIDPKRAKLVALIEHMDDGIGRVLEQIKSSGIERDTLVIFTSDNGGVRSGGANNGPWRGQKGGMYEGSLRVPAAARWPARIKPATRIQRTALSMDIFPTALDAAGASVPDTIDGVSFLPSLLDPTAPDPKRDLYFVRREGGAAFGGKTIEAIRRGDWKLLQPTPFAPQELYNLKADPEENDDQLKKEPKIVAELQAAMRNHVQQGGSVPWQSGK